VAVVIVAAAGLAAALSGHSSPPSNGQSTTLQRLEAANDSKAAAWVLAQVSKATLVSCDKQMCAALEAHGFPRAKVVVLGPTSNYPVNSQLVIETAAVRQLFGSILASGYAPVVLTAVGSGAAAIQIRVIAAHGTTAYLQQLATDLANRRKLGTLLLGGSRVTTSSEAHAQMAAGQVDARALIAILNLAGAEPVDILGFGNVTTYQTPGVPLRYMDLAGSDKASGLSGSAYVDALKRALDSLSPSERPLQEKIMKTAGGTVLRITFPAPTPLGLLTPP
jgi:hypothetical protein